MMRWILVVAVAAGCGSKSSTVAAPDERGEPGAGELGSVCHCHDRDDACREAPCQAGLVCSYPCGIDGCNSVCMTPEEAERSKTIP